jgi:galactose mutarotase-like enzyme
MSGLHLRIDGTTAEIARDGAELRSWSVAGTPLLWSPDPAIWADSAPILFPVVGWTRGSRILVDGQPYPLGLHGFARAMPFDVIEQGPAHVRLALAACDRTRLLYPFDFSLEVEHRLGAGSLTTRLHVRNDGARAMPYACGLHPGFRWPFAGGAMEDYAILFGEAERAEVPVISSEGLLTRKHRPVPLDGRRLVLSPGLMEREALCFLEARSRSLRFAHRSGAAIEVALENFPHLALWSRPAGGFLSIEAWTGHGDFVDADGDLFAKPSMIHLAPGASATHAATFAFV